jgi:CspA family cold shock protein
VTEFTTIFRLKEISMTMGVVKWFDAKKGYGFIQPEQGKDVFVHITALKQAGLQTLNEGQRVKFELATNKGKTSAVELEVID